MMCRRFAVALAAVALASMPAVGDDRPRPITADARKRAAAHYQQGITHYNLGEFEKAVTEFKAAYELSQEPDLLFNVGQAYRLQEDYKQALFFYDAYLRLRPDAVNRTDVEARIAEAKKLLEDQKSLQTAPPHGAIEPAAPVPEVAPALPPASEPPPPAAAPVRVDVQPRRSSLTVAGWVTGAVGIAGAAAGVYFASRARSGWDELTELSDERGTWSEHHGGVERDARRSERIAVVLIATGGAAVATGAVLWYLGWRSDREREQPTFAINPSASGGRASLSWRF